MSKVSVVKIEGYVGINDDDVGNMGAHVGKISFHVGITLEMVDLSVQLPRFLFKESLASGTP
ncbi:hypothetical protein [Paenisporosarcina indica]|uniref:hypothetical protein n=1 Tax=Paenisporosarcina indica TaxID=650093 RepID=UPI000A7B6B99|nr:hypothetical protein [Paenisporosarcina indica]